MYQALGKWGQVNEVRLRQRAIELKHQDHLITSLKASLTLITMIMIKQIQRLLQDRSLWLNSIWGSSLSQKEIKELTLQAQENMKQSMEIS